VASGFEENSVCYALLEDMLSFSSRQAYENSEPQHFQLLATSVLRDYVMLKIMLKYK
jgi:hypothetical protein